jgi:hypothetical protein
VISRMFGLFLSVGAPAPLPRILLPQPHSPKLWRQKLSPPARQESKKIPHSLACTRLPSLKYYSPPLTSRLPPFASQQPPSASPRVSCFPGRLHLHLHLQLPPPASLAAFARFRLSPSRLRTPTTAPSTQLSENPLLGPSSTI